MDIPVELEQHMHRYSSKLDGKLKKMYENCFLSTVKTALRPQEDGSYFVLTGDITAMWLRDSAAEVNHYIKTAKNSETVKKIIRITIAVQLQRV